MLLRDEVHLVRCGRSGTAFHSAQAGLARSFDAQHDEAVLTRELLLGQDPVACTGLWYYRRSHALARWVARRPGIAIGLRPSLSHRSGSVPNNFLRPNDVCKDVAIVERVNVVLLPGEFSASPAFEYVVPAAEQHFALFSFK